jgi:hypothetical protein
LMMTSLRPRRFIIIEMREMDGRDFIALKGARKDEMPCDTRVLQDIWDMDARWATGCSMAPMVKVLDWTGWS